MSQIKAKFGHNKLANIKNERPTPESRTFKENILAEFQNADLNKEQCECLIEVALDMQRSLNDAQMGQEKFGVYEKKMLTVISAHLNITT